MDRALRQKIIIDAKTVGADYVLYSRRWGSEMISKYNVIRINHE